MKRILLLIFATILVIGCSHRHVTNAINKDMIKIGMTVQEVKDIVGNPDRTGKRELKPGDIRETLSYREFYLLNGWTHYEYQHFIFVNGKLVGWNMGDQGDPDIIIENRLR